MVALSREDDFECDTEVFSGKSLAFHKLDIEMHRAVNVLPYA